MKCSVFIATSADGYIAKIDGSVDWLHTAGNPKADMGDNLDMGFVRFFNSVDCLIMGRKSMEVISNMNLTPEQWPYGDTPIIVLSKTLKGPPANLMGKVEMYAGELPDLIKKLEHTGYQHAYIDGGATITSFINLKYIDEMIITRAPILLGAGIPLFGDIIQNVKLENAQTTAFPNDFIQVKYSIKYL